MGQQFNRDLILNVGGVGIRTRDPKTLLARPTLKATFQVTSHLKGPPNTADLSIYNLNSANRVKLQEKNAEVSIEAGYADNVAQLFAGQLQHGSSVHDGTDWITTMQSGDGAKAYKTARSSTSFSGPVNVEKVLESVAKDLGLGLGNLKEKVKEKGLRATLTEYANGFVAHGKTEKILQGITKSMGYGVSIQGNQLLLLGPNETVNPDEAILLTSSTGMVGSPEPGEKGIVKQRALLQPQLQPGRKVKIQAREVDGFFRVDKVVFSGDTWGGDWYADLELRPL